MRVGPRLRSRPPTCQPCTYPPSSSLLVHVGTYNRHRHWLWRRRVTYRHHLMGYELPRAILRWDLAGRTYGVPHGSARYAATPSSYRRAPADRDVKRNSANRRGLGQKGEGYRELRQADHLLAGRRQYHGCRSERFCCPEVLSNPASSVKEATASKAQPPKPS